MSGRLVGEVIAAAPQLRAGGLSKNGFLALLAIAEKCHHVTNEGSVRWGHICDGLYGGSRSTAERAVKELKDSGYVRVVKPGWANKHGDYKAPVYELRITRITSLVTESKGEDHVTGDGIQGEDSVKSKLDSVKSELDSVKPPPLISGAPTLDGPIDGPIDGGAREREPLDAEPAPDAGGVPPPKSEQSANGIGSADRSTAATSPPSPYCVDHPQGTPKSCNACGGARRAREAWDQEQAAHIDAERAAIRAEISACPDCDQNGLTEPEEGPTRRCTQHRQLADLPTIRRAS